MAQLVYVGQPSYVFASQSSASWLREGGISRVAALGSACLQPLVRAVDMEVWLRENKANRAL